MAIPKLENKNLPMFADWICGAWSGTKFFILQKYGDVLVSSTGVEGTWAQFTPTVDSISMWLNGAAAAGDVLVAVSNGGDGFSLATNDAGTTWYHGTMSAKAWTAVATDGAGLWVAVAEDGAFIDSMVSSVSSDNGQTWTPNTGLDSSHPWEDIEWTGTKFIAGSADGYISTSTDGLTWSSPLLITSASVHNFFIDFAISRVYANIGSGSAEIAYSDDDGASWTTVVLPFEAFDNAAGLYKDGIIVIGGTNPNTAYTTDITLPFETGFNLLNFNPSGMLFGDVGGTPTAIGISRFSSEYLYGTNFVSSSSAFWAFS